MPSLMLGLSGASAAAIGMSGDMLKVWLGGVNGSGGISAGRDSMSVFGGVDVSHGAGDAGGTYNIPWIPSLMMGCSGASAAGIGMSGDAMNVNLVNAGISVDVTVASHVEVSNDHGPALFIQGTSGGGSGAAEAVQPVFVAGGTYGEAVRIEGTGGMTPVEVRGASAATYYPVGITSGCGSDHQSTAWSMASDEALLGSEKTITTHGIGGTLDNIYNIIANGLLGDDPVGTPVQKFATQATLSAMRPDGSGSATKIANEKNQVDANDYLENISNAFGNPPDPSSDNSLNVNVISFPQPSSFVHGQKSVTIAAAPIHGSRGLSSGVKIKGHQNNQDYIYVGVSGVDYKDGYPLGPSEEVFLEIDDISAVYVHAQMNGTACYIGS